MKQFLLTFIILLNVQSFANEARLTDFELMEKQLSYINNLKYLNGELVLINESLENCRLSFFKNANSREQEIYLGSTEKFSIEVLTMKAMVSKSIENLEKEISENKDKILKNLRSYEKELDNHLKSNEERTNRIVKNMKNGINEVSAMYCSGK